MFPTATMMIIFNSHLIIDDHFLLTNSPTNEQIVEYITHVLTLRPTQTFPVASLGPFSYFPFFYPSLLSLPFIVSVLADAAFVTDRRGVGEGVSMLEWPSAVSCCGGQILLANTLF